MFEYIEWLAFTQLYNKTGMELCVVVTNLTNMEEEYFHPKTTPDVALRLAIRMSISIPGKKINIILEGCKYIKIEIIFVIKIDSKDEKILMIQPY